MGDLSQWLSLTEHDVLLHNGLLRATGLIPVPSGITYQTEEDRELPSFDGKTPDELATILDHQCSEQGASFANLMEYRLNALKGLWKARGQLTSLEASSKEQHSPSASQGVVQDDSNTGSQSFASVVALILVFPILRSLSKTDPSLSSDVAKTLLQQLRSYPPFSLSKEPLECITGVEQLLVSWLHSAATQDDKQLQNAASALVALAVAQGSPPLILRTVHELQSFQSRDLHLLVPSVLSTLLESHIAGLTPSPLTATHHRTCWEYDHPSTNNQELDQKQSKVPSITTDGQFLYILYPLSGSLVKLGTGEGGTLRGFCYTQASVMLEPGFIAWANGALFYRKHTADVIGDSKQSSGQQQPSKLSPFCHRIDHHTLQVTADISCDGIVTREQMKTRNTLHFTSDGTHLYWLYNTTPPAAGDKNKEKNKQEQVYLETLIVKDGEPSVIGKPVVLQSLQGSSQQAMEQNEMIRFILRAHTHGISPSAFNSLLTHQSNSSSSNEGSNVTSCGLPLAVLKCSVVYCCGTFLVMVVPATVAKKSKSLLAPVSTAGKKALCQCFCYRLTDGSCVEQTELNPTSELQCALTKDGTLDDMSACYDATNHTVWTLANGWIDLWECSGSLALHQVAQMLGKTSVDELLYGCTTGDTLPITNTIDTLVKHLGMQGCQKDKSCPDAMHLRQCISILKKGVLAQQWDVVHCMAALLQALLSQLKDGCGDDLIAELQSVVWNLVNYSKSPASLQPLLHKIISEHFVVLYPTKKQRNKMLYQLCQSNSPKIVSLRGEIFACVGLDHTLMQQLYGNLEDVGGVFTLTRACCEESVVTLKKCRDLADDEFQLMVKRMPVFTPLMQFTASAVCSYMYSGCVARTNVDDTEESWKQLSKFLDGVLGACKECLDVLVEVCQGISEERRTRGGLERVVQTTLLGAVLPSMLTVLSDKKLKLYCIADGHLGQLHQLAQSTSEAAQLLHPDASSYHIPLPWATGCTLETIHPVKDGYKYKNTVVFPGARNLFLKFDPRCASQYDYDKVIVYAGDSPKGSKVAEYGGNTYGYGSRSVLGGGWPSQSVKVEGDTVTIIFEMKSGREHNTPDKAVWGFACTVRPQEVSSDDGCSSLPFMIDLSLAMTSLSCSLISQLYAGPAVCAAEQECQALMTSPLLQRCVWESTWADEKVLHQGHVKVDVNKVVPTNMISHEPLAAHVIQKLRDIAGKPQPTFRKRVRDLIKPDKLEDLMITVSLKHLGIPPALEIVGIYISTQELDPQILEVLQAIFLRVDALLRRLQSLVELELTWAQEVLEISQGTMELRDASFLSLAQQESSIKQFEFLCCLKDIELSQCDPYQASKKLQELMERDVEKAKSKMAEKGSSSTVASDDSSLNDQLVVKSYVDAIIDRTKLLLYVTMATDDPSTPLTSDYKEPVILSPTTGPALLRSFSAPPPSLTKSGSFTEYTRHSRSTAIPHHSVLDISSSSPTHATSLLDQIFQFIGDQPETAVSVDTFLMAARHQWVRGWCRHRALEHIQELLELQAEQGIGLVEVVTKLGITLKKGLRISEVSCSGCMTKLRDAMTQTMKCLVDLASQQPFNCINTISIISIIPYSKDDEACIVYSGLVKLLDKLCSKEDAETQSIELEKPIEEAIEEEKQSDIVGQLAWGAFRVLAARCVSWETKQNGSDKHEVLSSGLAQQVSSLLTNHLSRAIQKMTASESGTAEALQDALSLLLGLSKSKLGCAILSQPICVSRLLGLLVDHRPSPKLLLIVLQLCRMALPLMTTADCLLMEVPAHPAIDCTHDNTPTVVTQLLLAKLAEYIVPDVSHTPSSSNQVLEVGGAGAVNGDSSRATTMDTTDTQNGRLSVYLHKRSDQSPQDVLQPLLCHDPRQFRTGAISGHVDHWMRMDRQLAEHNKAEIITDEKRVAIRKAIRWAQLGFTISLSTPVEGTSAAVADQKKAKQEAECKKRNLELMRTDPPRPFLSGHVANSLASEIIGLLHSLLTEPGSAAVWAAAVKQILGQALSSVPQLMPKLSKYVEEIHSALMISTAPVAPASCLHQASLATAAFATLGGFHESLRPGLRVEVTGGGVTNSFGTITSILDRRGMAVVQFEDDSVCYDPRQSLEVPLSRLSIPQRGSVSLSQLNLQKDLAVAVCTAVDAPTPSLGLVPAMADASTCAMGMCRLVAELRSRACMALSYHIGDKEFCHSLLTSSTPSGQSCMPLLSLQAEECCPGERLSVVSSHCESLRMLYRDCSRPAPPHHAPQVIKPKHFMLDPHSSWPKISSCLFADNMANVTYFGAAPQPASSSSSSSSNPASSPAPSSNQDQLKGVVIYANMSLPSGCPSFYWEMELCSLGDSGSQEEGRHVGMGLSSKPSIPQGGSPPTSFTFMKDTCLVRSSGKAVQYVGEGILDRKSFRVSENSLKATNVLGCGWVCYGEELAEGQQAGKGHVYFTVNGQKATEHFDNVPSSMTPFIHLPKKGVRVNVNFGERPFLYAEGRVHRDAADGLSPDSQKEMAAIFSELPFHGDSDDEQEPVEHQATPLPSSDETQPQLEPVPIPGPPMRRPKSPIATVGYHHSTSVQYLLGPSMDTVLESTAKNLILVEEESGSAQAEDQAQQDPHALLVKAWEAQVFPMIKRRFRNDAERKSGLEQIRGALQLGMEDIALQTVEFLYEENGGLPRDLVFPTLEDVKRDADKLTMDHCKKGLAVVISSDININRCGVRPMSKTLGLIGNVLLVDKPHDLVQVECYLPSEGALVHYWYHVSFLQRPPPGYRRSPAMKGAEVASSPHVHRELLACEASLVHMYCRQAVLELSSSQYMSLEPLPIEPHLQHLHMLCCSYFAEPLPDCLTVSENVNLAHNPQHALLAVQGTLLDNFFHSADMFLKQTEQVVESFTKAEQLVLLTEKLLQCLHNSPKQCGHLEIKLGETKENTDIHFPSAAFLYVSCLATEPPAVSKQMWVQVFCYKGGQGKAGRQQLQEVIQYPSESPPHFPTVLLPFDRVHVKMLGCTASANTTLVFHALPPNLLLALAFSAVLLRVRQTSEQLTQSLQMCFNRWEHFLKRYDAPSPLKQSVFQLLSQLSCTTPSIKTSSDLVTSLQSELKQLYEKEVTFFQSSSGSSGSKGKTKVSLSFPPKDYLTDGGTGRFSNYLQSLLELYLVINRDHGVEKTEAELKKKTSKGKKSAAATAAKEETKDWLTKVSHIVESLLPLEERSCSTSSNAYFDQTLTLSLPVKIHNRLLVVTGLPTGISCDDIRSHIQKLTVSHGGLYRSELYVASEKRIVPATPDDDVESLSRLLAGEKDKQEGASAADGDVKLDEKVIDDGAGNDDTKGGTKESKHGDTGGVSRDDKQIDIPLGHVILEVSSSVRLHQIKSAILSSSLLKVEGGDLAVHTVSDQLQCSSNSHNNILHSYLKGKLCASQHCLHPHVKELFIKVFNSSIKESTVDGTGDKQSITGASKASICDNSPCNLFKRFLNGYRGKTILADILNELYGEQTAQDGGLLPVEKFLDWVTKQCWDNVTQVWSGLLVIGYNLHFERVGFCAGEFPLPSFSDRQDQALVHHIDSVCRQLSCSPSLLQTADLVLNETHFVNKQLQPLQGMDLLDIRMRFLCLQYLNQHLLYLLPILNLLSTHSTSLAVRLCNLSNLMFYDHKITFLHHVINASARRAVDQAPPEIKLDPLEVIGDHSSVKLSDTQFCQAVQQLVTIPSQQLCVRLASGGDPTYSFNVKMAGEEVHGTSGSFRQFLWQVVKELQSPLLPILMACPSSAVGINKGKYILAPGSLTFPEEKLLQFFGQLLGVIVRADIPVGLDLMPYFWRALLGKELTLDDLREADIVTYTLTEKIMEATTTEEFSEVIGAESFTFTLNTLDGRVQELCKDGANITVNWDNRADYVRLLREKRLEELAIKERIAAVKCGLATIIPLEVLSVFSEEDLDLRVCGIPEVDLDYLKIHTMYQVGLMETDKHVQFFWEALASFSQEELRKFIKFACNQERIPHTCPCRDGGSDITHVPPYPMKIAPPDGSGTADSRYIRAETCLFMVKLPQYSSVEIMNEKLRYAINCREDPLSG